MDPLKDAFDKIKQDILYLRDELLNLNSIISNITQQNLIFQDKITKELTDLTQKVLLIQSTPTIPTHIPTHPNPFTSTPTHIPTHQQALKEPISQNIQVSIRNEGVPTDKPTNQQTNQQTDNYTLKGSPNTNINTILDSSNSFERASEILESLDSLKKEIRLKFKRLTSQEMLIFSTLYTLEEQNIEEISYKTLAQYLRLSESSIRDYITKLKSKGIPIIKMRLNNKKIALKISQDLKKIATLSTIMRLRDL
jgi:biotin operon repressor